MVEEQQAVKDQISRIVEIYMNSKGAIRPSFMLTGPSGSGKSHIISELAAEMNIAFMEINAAQLTKEGTSGNSLSKALSPLVNMAAGKPTIVFVDEFDKLFISGNSNSDLAHETTNGVQNEFLKVLESSTTSVFGDYGKYVEVAIDHVLFVFAGAFNGEENITLDRLREFGIKTEFLGRVGLLYELKKLSVNSMHEVLKNHRLLNMYTKLFPQVKSEKVIGDIMNKVNDVHDNNTLGIRILDTLLNQYFINDGVLDDKMVEQATFQSTMSFGGDPANAPQ